MLMHSLRWRVMMHAFLLLLLSIPPSPSGKPTLLLLLWVERDPHHLAIHSTPSLPTILLGKKRPNRRTNRRIYQLEIFCCAASGPRSSAIPISRSDPSPLSVLPIFFFASAVQRKTLNVCVWRWEEEGGGARESSPSVPPPVSSAAACFDGWKRREKRVWCGRERERREQLAMFHSVLPTLAIYRKMCDFWGSLAIFFSEFYLVKIARLRLFLAPYVVICDFLEKSLRYFVQSTWQHCLESDNRGDQGGRKLSKRRRKRRNILLFLRGSCLPLERQPAAVLPLPGVHVLRPQEHPRQHLLRRGRRRKVLRVCSSLA